MMNFAIAVALAFFFLMIALILVYYMVTYKETIREFENSGDEERNPKIPAPSKNT